MNYRTAVKASLVLTGSVLLAGCSNWSFAPSMHGNPVTSTWTHPEVQDAASQGGAPFDHAVAHEYDDYANYLAGLPQGVWVDSDYFSRKGLKASDGDMVMPENNSNWAIPLETPLKLRTQMADGRGRLMAALDGGGRDRYPVLAARAQARYDCWLERTEKDWQTNFDGTCHREFIASLDELERNLHGVAAAPPPAQAIPARQFNVYFDFDRSELTAQARQIIDQAKTSMGPDKSVRIVLVGKADLSGTDPYNLALSHRRADTVRSALKEDGVQANQIDESWVGEREPPVSTADGVREPRNRVVEITLN